MFINNEKFKVVASLHNIQFLVKYSKWLTQHQIHKVSLYNPSVPLELKSATSITLNFTFNYKIFKSLVYIIQRLHYCFSYFTGMGTALSVTSSRSGWALVSRACGTYLISCSHVVVECASGLC